MTTIRTVGHGTADADELGELLRGADVTEVVDVRRFPGSRRHPQFSAGIPVGELPYDRPTSPSCLPSRRMSTTMALDARTRSSIDGKLVPVLGEDDANALMSEFPASEADELVTERFLRAELAELENRLTMRFRRALGGSIAASTAILGVLISIQ